MSPFAATLVPLTILLFAGGARTGGDAAGKERLRQALEFHQRAMERTGVLVPMYVYPGNVDKNPEYTRLMTLRRRYETVPMWVIVNPASGPGEAVDPNYTKAIARLRGAGCVVVGYVSTSFGKRPAADVKKDIDRWLKLYPGVQGIFFDEMRNEDTDAAVAYQTALNRYAHDTGCWPTVANPGTDTPARYFAAPAADVIVVHEGGDWPKEERLKRDTYADFPPFTRGILVHSRAKLDKAALRLARQHARWVYATEAPFRAGDPKAANPWDRVSAYLEELCTELSGK
ncbi:MAG: spherulation-specific family 4 protein [Gemmataceae bacterium]